MKPKIIKSRDKNRILKRITELAESYTPDWNPDFKDPDFGSALSLIFKDMYLEQAERLNRMPNKQRRDIVNLFAPAPHGPEASRGYVSFELSEGASSGVFLDSGFQLLAEGADDTEIHFETIDPLFVTHAKMEHAVVYDHETGWFSTHKSSTTGLNFPLFKVDYENNENRPHFEITDPKWLYIRNGMQLGLKMTTSHELDHMRLLDGLSDTSKANWYVIIADEKESISVKVSDDCLWVELDEKLRINGSLYCELIDIPYFRDIEITDFVLHLKMNQVKPEKLLYNDNLIEESTIHPFGERFNIFDVFLIGDQDVFNKEGAHIQIQMKMKEHLMPIENDSDELLVKWRNVMHESELREPEAKTVRIESIIWEYWNGIGWSPLQVNSEAYQIPSDGIWHVEFVCPNDLTPAIFGPSESHYIRARITKVQNAFAPKGTTAVPIIKNISINANTRIQKNAKETRTALIKLMANNEVIEIGRDMIPKTKIQFSPAPDEDIHKAVYVSLTEALVKGPIRFEVEPHFHISKVEPAAYKIQYYGIRGGREDWHDLPHEDESNGFMMNGLVSFMAPKHMKKICRFGLDVYWIRLIPMNGTTEYLVPRIYHRDLNMRLNAIMIRQKETLTSEYYAIPAIQPWASITLSRSPVLEVEVWMNEIGIVSDEELDFILETDPASVNLEQDKRGELIGIWRRWNQVKDFYSNPFEGRIYTLDLELGKVTFGDGKNGRIPHSDLPEYIRVDYALGGGIVGNLKPGMVNKAVTSIPFLERVYNGGPIWGGLGIESTKHAESRISDQIRHRGLALSARDIASIIAAQNRDIHDVKVSGFKGEIKISILPDEYPYQISHYFEIKEKTKHILENSISHMLSSQNRFTINEPIKIAYSINMDVVVESAGDYIKALSRWNDQLEKYFDPLRGGPKNRGWQIGKLPEHSAILSDLKHMLEGTEQIDNVMVQMHYVDGKSRTPIHHGSSLDLNHAIPVNGEHDVRIRITNLK